MNFALPPDSDWDDIAKLTGDASWESQEMRKLFIEIENCTYTDSSVPGHGFEGPIKVLMA